MGMTWARPKMARNSGVKSLRPRRRQGPEFRGPPLEVRSLVGESGDMGAGWRKVFEEYQTPGRRGSYQIQLKQAGVSQLRHEATKNSCYQENDLAAFHSCETSKRDS